VVDHPTVPISLDRILSNASQDLPRLLDGPERIIRAETDGLANDPD